jgi:hypothetical protein
MRTVSNVDQQARPYFVSLLHSPVKPLFDADETRNRWGSTPARTAASKRASAARKQRDYEIGERIFEKLKWHCNTKEFSIALQGEGLRLLRKLEDQKVVVCTEERIGTKPSKWKWIGRKAEQ